MGVLDKIGKTHKLDTKKIKGSFKEDMGGSGKKRSNRLINI